MLCSNVGECFLRMRAFWKFDQTCCYPKPQTHWETFQCCTGHGLKIKMGASLSWIIFFPAASEGSSDMTLACCPFSWISLTLWPRCRSLKSQSRKTPGLICYDGSACHPDGIWRTETSCSANKEPFMSAGKERKKRKKKPSTAAPANRRDEWTDTMLYHFYVSLQRNWLC